ncbi:hypothetical protein SERLA73DRAFT_46678, partial [Serpula lacrymans var. lacrymans S7.3]
YLYCASFPAAVLFSVLFGLVTILHIIQGFYYRKRFTWVIVMAGIWQTIGLVTRTLSTLDQSQSTYAIPSQLLILLSPLWINAFDYMLLGRMAYYFLPDHKIAGMRADKLARWFVLADITAFIVQGAGGSLTTSTDSTTLMLGVHIYMGGIGLQECFIIFFFGLAVMFHKRMNRGEGLERPRDWRRLLYVLYATLGLITLRIIYRLVEYSDGFHSTITESEAFYYCLDALPMFCAIALYNVWHPGLILIGLDSDFPKKVKKTKEEKKREKEEEKNRKHRRNLSEEDVPTQWRVNASYAGRDMDASGFESVETV